MEFIILLAPDFSEYREQHQIQFELPYNAPERPCNQPYHAFFLFGHSHTAAISGVYAPLFGNTHN